MLAASAQRVFAVSMLVAAFAVLAQTTLAQTTVGGPILDDTTWTVAGSPYQVVSNIIVGDDATLTIGPGVTVEFDDGLGMDIGSASFGTGTIVARGTAADPIVFKPRAADPVPTQWEGITLTPFAVDGVVDPDTGAFVSGSILEHFEISFARVAVDFQQGVTVLKNATVDQSLSGLLAELTGDTQAHVSDMLVHDSTSGMTIRGGSGHVLTGISGIDNQSGLSISNASDVTILGGLFERMGSRGMDVSSADRLTIESVRIEGSLERGMTVSGSEGLELRACSFIANAEGGASLATVPGARIIDCEFRGNFSPGTPFHGVAGLSVSRGDDITIEGCVFEANDTQGTGAGSGAIDLWRSARATVTDVDFIRNESLGDGGAAYIEESPGVVFSDVRFTDNLAGERGGAVYVLESPDAVFEASTFGGNAASDGGGVFVDAGSTGISFAGDPDARRFNVFDANVADRGQDMFNGLPFDLLISGDVDASDVCWGTLEQFEVQQRIWDGFDDPLLGFIVANPLADCDTCRADIDGDGELTIFDFLGFQNAFDAGDLAVADFDGDGSLTIFDFLAFQNEFDLGCG